MALVSMAVWCYTLQGKVPGWSRQLSHYCRNPPSKTRRIERHLVAVVGLELELEPVLALEMAAVLGLGLVAE